MLFRFLGDTSANSPVHKRQASSSGAPEKRQALIGNTEGADQVVFSDAATPQRSEEEQMKLNEQLICAISSDDIELVRLSLECGAQVRNTLEYTPLHRAVYHRQPRMVAFLLENGAKPDINEPNAWGETPLHLAACSGALQVIGLLLEQGAIINQPDRQGRTSLHLAAQVGEPEVADFLLRNRAAINQSDCMGQTPLHLAAQFGMSRMVDLLLKEGATGVMNQSDELGETPLSLAVKRQRLNVTHLLLHYGAEPALLPLEVRQRYRQTLQSILKKSYLKLDVAQLIQEKKASLGVAELSPAQLNLLKAQVRGALGIVHRLSNAGVALDIVSARQVQEGFSAALTETNRRLGDGDLARLHKVKLLARIRPILRSGFPLDQKVVTVLAQHAVNLNYAEGFKDALGAGADPSALIPLL